MPYDTIGWGESAAKNGLTATTAKIPTGIGYTVTGDTIILKDLANPWLLGMGTTGTTKPNGGRIVPSNQPSSYYCNGAIQFWPSGWTDLQGLLYPHLRHPIALFKGDTLTGYSDSANTDEETLLIANICYGSPLPVPNLSRFAGAVHYAELGTVTTATAITDMNGGVTIYNALTNKTNWYNPTAEYYLLGISGHIGVADGAGVLQFYNLPGKWSSFRPGIPINMISGVTFSSEQPFTPFAEPIGPISGEGMKNSASVGGFLSGAAAATFTLHFCKTRG